MTKQIELGNMSLRQIDDALSMSQLIKMDINTVKALEKRRKELEKHHCEKGSPCDLADHNLLSYGSVFDA
jgi:hypothetical protein